MGLNPPVPKIKSDIVLVSKRIKIHRALGGRYTSLNRARRFCRDGLAVPVDTGTIEFIKQPSLDRERGDPFRVPPHQSANLDPLVVLKLTLERDPSFYLPVYPHSYGK